MSRELNLSDFSDNACSQTDSEANASSSNLLSGIPSTLLLTDDSSNYSSINLPSSNGVKLVDYATDSESGSEVMITPPDPEIEIANESQTEFEMIVDEDENSQEDEIQQFVLVSEENSSSCSILHSTNPSSVSNQTEKQSVTSVVPTGLIIAHHDDSASCSMETSSDMLLIPDLIDKSDGVEEGGEQEENKGKSKNWWYKRGARKGAIRKRMTPKKPASASAAKTSSDSTKAEPKVAVTVIQPQNLFEYQWPLDDSNADFYFLQEQISEYLGVKSFKRKYPELQRRPVEMNERVFLKEKGVVTETQCDLGLTVLKSEEIMDLMLKDYPDKYQAYNKALREKEKASLSEKYKGYNAAVMDKTKINNMVKRIAKQAASWNSRFNKDRREKRRCCIDLQTHVIHYPASRYKRAEPEVKKQQMYPIALVPQQYQDYYKRYTPTELKYLPLNSVLYGPINKVDKTDKALANNLSDGSDSDDDSSSSDSNSRSSQGDMSDSDSSSSSNSVSVGDKSIGKTTTAEPGTPRKTGKKYVRRPNARPAPGPVKDLCRVCMRDGTAKRLGTMITCSQCGRKGHSTCLELAHDLLSVIVTYPWQCMECKSCALCHDPNDEEKMMFCDVCDRGYHTFCVGLGQTLPQGRWICGRCGQCTGCSKKSPAEGDAPQPDSNMKEPQWHHSYFGRSKESVKTYCVECAKKFSETSSVIVILEDDASLESPTIKMSARKGRKPKVQVT